MALIGTAMPIRAELLYDFKGDFSLEGPANAIISADFNDDGHLDLATPTGDNPAVEVLLGDGAGTFGQNQRFTITGDIGRPRAMVTADFDKNGTLDLAVTTIQEFLVPNHVSVILGTGDGSFGSETVFGVGVEPLSIATADFNSDEVPDLVTANRFSDNISVLLGTGDGGFGEATNFSTLGIDANALVVGKLNGDPHMDIVVTNGETGDISVFLGNGLGSFTTPITYAAGGAPFVGMALADLNNDGFLDLGLTYIGMSTIGILMGNGDGTFDPPRAIEVGKFPRRLYFAKLNQDDKTDLIVTKFFNGGQGDNEAIVLPGYGDGSFGKAVTIYSQPNDGIRTIELAVSDFNGDGVQDFAFSKKVSFVGDFLSVYLGRQADDIEEFPWELFLPAIQTGAKRQ